MVSGQPLVPRKDPTLVKDIKDIRPRSQSVIKRVTRAKEGVSVEADFDMDAATETGARAGRADLLPTDGYAVAVDAKIKSTYRTAEEAFKAGSEIKRKFPVVQVTIYDAKAGTRTPVEAPSADSADSV
jgi:hypothetical protein